MNKIEWRSVVGFDGIYEVNNYGHVRSLDRVTWNGRKYFPIKGQPIKHNVDQYGYYQFRLSKNGKYKNFTAHRLVALMFIDNPDPKKLTHVNHKDCIKTNNHVSNLEWVTVFGNNKHAKDNGRMKNNGKNLIHNNQLARKPLYQMSIDGTILAEWSHLGGVPETIISRTTLFRALSGRRKYGKGFIWKYKDVA